MKNEYNTMKLRKQIEGHKRNNNIQFLEDEHKYFYYPSGDFRKKKEREQFYGVTSWMKDYLPPFDMDGAANATSRNPNSKWYGWDIEDIKADWISKRDYGTDGHKAIETVVNTGEITEEWSDEIGKMFDLLDAKGIEPVFSEWVVYDEDVKRASAIDLCGSRNGVLVPIDMKFFAKGMQFSAYKGETFNYPLNDIPSSKFDKVSLQLSIYSLILEKKYPDVPLADERYVLCYSDNKVELLPTLDYRDYAKELYNF